MIPIKIKINITKTQSNWLIKRIAHVAFTIARIEPTDRSIPPVVITNVIAVAAINIGAL